MSTLSTKKATFSTKQIVFIGLMSALVFVTNYISFSIPLMAGAPTRVHIANGFCLVAGMALGPLSGGLSAGIGSMLYDFTNPVYISSAPFTFLFKFLLAFCAAHVAHSGGRKAQNRGFTLAGAAVGQLVYILLYLGKKFITTLLVGNAMETAISTTIAASFPSMINAVIAVILCMVLLPVFQQIGKRVGF